MAWPKLRKSRPLDTVTGLPVVQPLATAAQRIRRLARKLDEIPAKDEARMREARELQDRQIEGGAALHRLCRDLVDALNSVLKNMQLDLSPRDFNPDTLESSTGTLFQINASGRIVQMAIYPSENALTTEHFRLPYVLRGAMRWFNQEYLERQEIQEQLLFYSLLGDKFSWRYYDPRSRRIGEVNQEFLAEALEQLL